MRQVKAEHYSFLKYVNEARWLSYYTQIRETLSVNPRKVLVIGVGDHIVPDILEKILGGGVDTFDFDSDVNPTICGDLRQITELIKKESYDCVICCQVLEHLSYHYFSTILADIKEILTPNGHMILSLPQGAYVSLQAMFRLGRPRVSEFRRTVLIPYRRSMDFPKGDEHQWEIGYKNYGLKTICKAISCYFMIEKQYTSYGNPYHHFFVLKK